jgi:hypothetical protein
MYKCTAVHSDVASLVNLDYSSESNQHIETGASCVKHDSTDLNKVLQWFQCNSPFVAKDSQFHSLGSGVGVDGHSGINSDEAETVGKALIQPMDGFSYAGVSLRNLMKLKHLMMYQYQVLLSTSGFILHIDSGVLFSKPSFMFKNSLML